MLPEPINTALAELARRFAEAGVDYCIGGSAMLRLSGLDVAVGDIDVLVGADSRAAVLEIFAGRSISEPDGAEPWRTEWFLRTDWPVGSQTVAVDILGGLALIIDRQLVRLPVATDVAISVENMPVPLASLGHWYHTYRAYDPTKAALIADRLSDEEIVAAADELGIGQLFSPTLIVRIGNGLQSKEIETGMSSDVQSSIIEVASPTDQKFDEPGTEIIDRALLEETLEYIRPALQADGGDLVLLGTEGGKVTLQMVGACGGCPLSTMTLTAGIERILQDRVPGVTEVVAL